MEVREVFQSHYDVPLKVEVLDVSIMKALMSVDKFEEIVIKMMSNKSNGIKFKTIEEQHEYYGITQP